MINDVTYLLEADGNFSCSMLIICLNSRIKIGKTSLLWGAGVGKSKFYYSLARCAVGGTGHYTGGRQQVVWERRAYDTQEKYRINEQLYKRHHMVSIFYKPIVRTWGLTSLDVFMVVMEKNI